MGVERNTAIYAPERPRTSLFLDRRISARHRAGMTATATDTTDKSRVYTTP